MSWFDAVHLDRMFVLSGVYDEGTDTTVWTLPITDETVNAIVLGPAFDIAAGTILTPDTVAADTVTLAGDYSAGQVAIGRSFTMSLELTRPYYRDREGNADADAWIQVRKVVASYHETGAVSLRASLPRRTDRTKSLDADPIAENGTLTAWFNGRADQMRLFIESDSPKPCTITALEYTADYAPRMG